MKMMIQLFLILLISIQVSAMQQNADTNANPLAKYSAVWKQPKYQKCNTAANVNYLTVEEKNLIWVLNMIRLSPKLYLNTVLLNPKCHFYQSAANRDYYYKSLIKDLTNLQPNTDFLFPDSSAYVSARCHAYYSGLNGYVGHDRKWGDCVQDFMGECCDYGFEDAVNIITHLLIDKNIPNLGHRIVCLSPEYNKLGTSIQPHQYYGNNAVLDFK